MSTRIFMHYVIHHRRCLEFISFLSGLSPGLTWHPIDSGCVGIFSRIICTCHQLAFSVPLIQTLQTWKPMQHLGSLLLGGSKLSPQVCRVGHLHLLKFPTWSYRNLSTDTQFVCVPALPNHFSLENLSSIKWIMRGRERLVCWSHGTFETTCSSFPVDKAIIQQGPLFTHQRLFPKHMAIFELSVRFVFNLI